MSAKLVDFIMSHKPASDRDLHLAHCTSAQATINILAEGVLRPKQCAVYGADLLYMFYGRPAYKPHANLEPSNIIELAPVCLVLDPSLLTSAVRMLPFDSGGFPRYEHLLGPNSILPAFELGLDRSAPLRLIRAFYETSVNYYEQQQTLGERQIPISRVGARAYARLIADPSVRAMDDRCSTIEIQFSTEVSLRSALKAVVGPTALFSDPDVLAAIQSCDDVTPMPYKTYGRTRPDQFSHAIYERVETFLSERQAFR